METTPEVAAGMSTATAIIVMLIVGAIAGWLAGVIMKGSGYGLIGDIVLGILGGVVGGWILRAEEFISPRFHLSRGEHDARVAAWA